MEPTPDDKLAASVFALGLSAGFVRREDVVRWADRRIAEGRVPPPWLIGLSISAGRHVLDVVGDLKAGPVDVGLSSDNGSRLPRTSAWHSIRLSSNLGGCC